MMASVVLVTGSSSGIGRLTVETLARAGHIVFASMRDIIGKNAEPAAEFQRLAADENLRVRVVELDVQNTSSVQAAVELVVREQGRIDVVVNNAGLMSIGLAEGFTEDQIAHQMDVNFMGTVRVSQSVLPFMRRAKAGLLIHVTSIVGRILFPACAFYCASKFAQEAYAEVLNYELAGTGVESIVVEPGPYPTHLLANSPGPIGAERLDGYGQLAGIRDQFIAQFTQLFASAQAPDPQEVADAILRLVNTPAGQRAMRTVCGLDFGANKLNETVAPMQAEVLRALAMEQMIPQIASNHEGKAASASHS
jgi:NAD(P)-dependent dehydrogenase (short-subunit alcohol dehydrogenase family)